MELRPYQAEAVGSVIKKWGDHNKLLLVLPTGTGKTIVFSKIIQHMNNMNQRCLILAHRDELIRQAQDKLKRSTGLDSAIEKAGETAIGSFFPVTVGSVQTMMQDKRLAQHRPDDYSVIIVDETHHILADSYQKVLKYFNGAKVLGVTATPDRGDKKNLGKYFDDLAYEYDIRQAIKDGFLCEIKAQTMPIDINMKGVRTTAGDYNARDLGSAIEPYLEQIADKMKEHVMGRKILVFLPLVRTSKIFEAMLQDRGFRPCHIDGKSEERKEILHMYNQNRYDVICNSMLLTEGYDQPDIDCVIVLRPTQSRSLYAQMIGRGTRVCPSKDYLLILDFLWNSERHKLCHPSCLIAEDDEIAQVMTEKAKKGGRFGLQELEHSAKTDAQAQREASLARYLDANKHRKGKSVDPMAWGILIDNEDVTGYETTWGWEKQECTQKQASTLQKYGFDTHKMTKGYASKILDGIFSRMEKDLASPKQVMLLQKFGYSDFSKMTFKEASANIDRIAKNGWSRDFRKEKR